MYLRLSAHLDIVVHDPAGVRKVRMLCVDVSQLDGNQVVDLLEDEKL